MKAVLDIGKTHVKLAVVKDNKVVTSFCSKNAPIAGKYLQVDVDGIWSWFSDLLHSCPLTSDIEAVVVTTHGATAALIDNRETDRNRALALPVLDYEFEGIDSCLTEYKKVRPPFAQTLSPLLPAGLNLGKQLYWLQREYPDAFACATHIVPYPQYWAWRLGGDIATEATSLGCHTDLWQPGAKTYSSLVDEQNWRQKMPPLRHAWDCLGVVSADVSQQTGLSPNCEIYAGIHDSNASFLRYLTLANSNSFNVISTGTWTILMQAKGSTTELARYKDTLVNVDIHGTPVTCARFMGGREYERICAYLGGNTNMEVAADDIQQAINEQWLVTPDFSQGNGPFGGAVPQIRCPIKPAAPQAIATLYCALMIDQRLSDLHSTGPIYIEGAFLKNPLLCALVAQLRINQRVYLSSDDTGTVLGAAALIRFAPDVAVNVDLTTCEPSEFDNLEVYRTAWYSAMSC